MAQVNSKGRDDQVAHGVLQPPRQPLVEEVGARGQSPAKQRVLMPTVAPMIVHNKPPTPTSCKTSCKRARSVRNRPGRRRRAAPVTACSVFPRAMPAAVTREPLPVRVSRKDAAATAGQRRIPKRISTARATPVAGQSRRKLDMRIRQAVAKLPGGKIGRGQEPELHQIGKSSRFHPTGCARPVEERAPVLQGRQQGCYQLA